MKKEDIKKEDIKKEVVAEIKPMLNKLFEPMDFQTEGSLEETYYYMSMPNVLKVLEKCFEKVYNKTYNQNKDENKDNDCFNVDYAVECLLIEKEHCKSGYKEDENNKKEYSRRVLELTRALKILTTNTGA